MVDGMSEEDVRAAELLDELKKSNSSGSADDKTMNDDESLNTDTIVVKEEEVAEKEAPVPPTLLDMVYNSSLINSMVEIYEGKGITGDGSSIVSNSENSSYSTRNSDGYVSKRQKLSKAIMLSRVNLKEYKLNMSIESKKRIITCLQLLKLANRQLTHKVLYLKDVIEKEQESLTDDVVKTEQETEEAQNDNDEINSKMQIPSKTENRTKLEDEDDDGSDDEFYDASDIKNEESAVIKMEVVGTVKKVYSMISKFTGSSLPEPARSQVRESLLQLPINWSTQTSKTATRCACNSEICMSPNCKVLILAKESLDMVQNVMQVLDSSLGKAEEWVKHRQEWKEKLREKIIIKQKQLQEHE